MASLVGAWTDYTQWSYKSARVFQMTRLLECGDVGGLLREHVVSRIQKNRTVLHISGNGRTFLGMAAHSWEWMRIPGSSRVLLGIAVYSWE